MPPRSKLSDGSHEARRLELTLQRSARCRGSHFKNGRRAVATRLASSTVSNDRISPPFFLVLISCSTMPESFVSVTTVTPSVIRTCRALLVKKARRASCASLSRNKKLTCAPVSPLDVRTRTYARSISATGMMVGSDFSLGGVAAATNSTSITAMLADLILMCVNDCMWERHLTSLYWT